MKAYVTEVVAELGPEHERIVFEMETYYGLGPHDIAERLGFPVARARALLRELAQHGVCAFGPLTSEDDGLMRGRGYWLDRFGQAVRDQLELRWLRHRATAAGVALSAGDGARMLELEAKEHCT